MAGHRIFGTPFASIYPHYVAKVERKGHGGKDEVDQVITWLTGYDAAGLERVWPTRSTSRPSSRRRPR